MKKKSTYLEVGVNLENIVPSSAIHPGEELKWELKERNITQKYFSEISPEENWQRAEAEWDALTPEMQAHLWSLSHQEEQCCEDIRQGLLATLHEYRGFRFVKELFADAIKCVKL